MKSSPEESTTEYGGYPCLGAGSTDNLLSGTWLEEIATIGGESPLLHFVDEATTRIELTTTHPGGLPQFITGRSVLLSNLIRDELALRNAALAATVIADKALELRSMRGIEATHLAVGLAQWAQGEESYTAPVLLRPLAIRRHSRDFELKLTGQPHLNPALVRALKEQFDIALDVDAFIALTVSNGVFKPQPVIDRLRGLTAHIESFRVQPRLIVSSFIDVSYAMTGDAQWLDHPVLRALDGDTSVTRRINDSHDLSDGRDTSSRRAEFLSDTLLFDADSEQEKVIANVVAGKSFVVKTLPGTGVTQTIVNAIGSLVARNKRVLVVGARRAALDRILTSLDDLGLGGVAVSARTLRSDLIRSISRNERAKEPHVADIDDALARLQKVLLDYRAALSKKDPVIGVSVLDALDELTRLANVEQPPATTSRLDRQSIEALADHREAAARILRQAAELGEFRYGPNDSPWYGASFSSTAEATVAHEIAIKLNETSLPSLLDKAYKLVGQTKMRPFESINELGIYLGLLLDLRETLDRFHPDVFDRPLTELIAATSGRKGTPGMSSSSRRRLRKLAYEYVRPGVHVNDINASLRRIQQQRTLWQRYVAAGVTPEVPVGISDVQVAYQHVSSELGRLDTPLGVAGTSESLSMLPISSLVRTLAGLCADSEVLTNLYERTRLLGELSEFNLAPLLADLSNRHVPYDCVEAELELAWWQSVLENLLTEQKALLGANTSVLSRLEADFLLVDEAHTSASAPILAHHLAQCWKNGIADWPSEADRLRELFKTDSVTPQNLSSATPHLMRVLAPVWLSSPYEVADIGPSVTFDTVILVNSGATTLAENVGAIRRGKQIIAFGDPVTQSPSPFATRICDAVPEPYDADDFHANSALSQLSAVLPSVTLSRSYRASGNDLVDFVNRRFYGGRIESLPWAGSYFGHASLTLTVVEGGRGIPDPATGTVESVSAEVDEVVARVLDHATRRPTESLMVITPSARHATHVHRAVCSAIALRTDLSEFMANDGVEPFTVATLEQAVAQSRDRVIFSIGYGRTPHGRLLSSFGPLSEPGGDRLLAVAMTRARRSMEIVSCFRANDLDPEKIKNGVEALAAILVEAERGAEQVERENDGEPLLIDLAAKLRQRDIAVALNYQEKLPLVASFNDRVVVVETDTTIARMSLRESLRGRPETLRRLGWHYLRVHSFELFTSPDTIVTRIATLLGLPSADDLSA